MRNPSCARCSGNGPPRFCACLERCGHPRCGGPTDLHAQRVAQARAALRGERAWAPDLTEPLVLAEACEAEFRAARELIDRALAAWQGMERNGDATGTG